MAISVVSVTTSAFGSNSTAHTYTYPTVSAGDLLIAVFAIDSTGDTFSAMDSGWNELTAGNISAGTESGCCWWRIATGSESGTWSATCTDIEQGAAVIYRTTGLESPATLAPDFSASASNTTGQVDPDSVTVTHGTTDYLLIARAAVDDGRDGALVIPSGYTGGTWLTSSAVAASGVRCAAFYRIATAFSGSEDPGVIDNATNNEGWVAQTIAFAVPAAGGGGRIMSSLVSHGGLAGPGGIAGHGGGLAG